MIDKIPFSQEIATFNDNYHKSSLIPRSKSQRKHKLQGQTNNFHLKRQQNHLSTNNAQTQNIKLPPLQKLLCIPTARAANGSGRITLFGIHIYA